MEESEYNQHVAKTASNDFERARRKAFLNDLRSTLGGRPNWLLAFEQVQSVLPIKGQSYRGMQEVPVASIVGSVDRYHDFDRAFLPTQTRTRPRWESVDRAAARAVVQSGRGLFCEGWESPGICRQREGRGIYRRRGDRADHEGAAHI